jgi:predicted nucleotidyltransferase
VLASGALARLLIDLAVRPDEAAHGREIQRRTGLTPRSLQAELDRLEALGIVRRRSDGRLVRWALDKANPRWRVLRALVRELAAPVDVIRDALADVPGVAAAFVFGSVARAEAREDSDVDVFLLDGGVDEDRLSRRILDAGVLLGREVNVVQMTPGELAAKITAGSGFVREVMRGAKSWVAGGPGDLDAALSVGTRGGRVSLGQPLA